MSQMPLQMSFVDYDPAYPAVFLQLEGIIHSTLPNALVEHVGSTSVAGLGGRGALDAVLLSNPVDQTAIVAALQQVGFTEFPYGPAKPALTTTIQFQGRAYGVLLYLLPHAHELVRGWLAFRQFMREHPDEVARYAAIKKVAIAEGKTQPWVYQEAKTPYLTELTERIC